MKIRFSGMLFAVAGAGSLLLGATQASADMYKSGGGSLYAGANYTFLNVDGSGIDADLGMMSAKVGAKVSPYLGVEARGGFGVADDSIGGGTDLELNALYGGYVTLNVDNPSTVTPYVIAGLTRYDYEVSGPGGTATEDESDFSYGIGIDMAFSDALSGNLEYMRYGDKDDVELDGLALGVTVSF
ncbi:outer membrane insertion C-terminal signal [Marinobacter daqiaonensis]|uniref:Outer membrane insertion C-terminal signal n=1 Tax=Marinobacter daqiaonensis TaxID=650891 RepID=A0A1I6GS19_9GAMM|nr:porin family protein [Marinobacter daqiaonensis]SFR44881.1 outer membrane insertion C-terminal signal [Marinobacter daqiaonensis]